jgi:hypothetical protein
MSTRADQLHSSDHNDYDDDEHHYVFDNILPSLILPKLKKTS